MGKYKLIYELQGGRTTHEYFDDFSGAFARLIEIYRQHDEDSCWLKDVYKTTEIQQWDEQLERYVPIRK